ncbi:MFS transporter [Candidatus Villigracilis proximus]|uniref:MFS transporter n=1 Tax=Candidatus Villigracilis proximus TaxID=3140683 RepID=UPI0031F001E8
MGLIGAVFGLAFLVGPILGGIILTVTGWQWLFIINLPIALTVIIMGWRVLPVSRPASGRPFDLAGMMVLGIMLASLAFGLNQIDTQNFFSSLASLSVWPFLLIGIVLLFVFPAIERKAEDPILNLNLFKSRQTVIASMLSAGAGLGESGMVFIPALAVAAMPSIINEHNASYLLMPVVLAMAVGSPLVGRLLDKFGSKVMVFGGTLLLAAGMIMLSNSSLISMLWGFIASGAVIGLGLSSLLGARCGTSCSMKLQLQIAHLPKA